MKLQKKLSVISTSLILSSLTIAPVMADDAPELPSSTPAATQVKYFDCHYTGAKDSQDMQAKITKDGDKYFWSDSVGETGTLTILPNHTITLDYTYVAKNKENVSGKMTFNVKEDKSLEGTYADSFDSGKITCVEHKG